MKKMSNNKRGFTLTEILIVVAIIVIVSAAAFTGVAITLSRARKNQEYLKENNGDNFELEARAEIDAINENAADFAEIPTYKPQDTDEDDDEDDDDDDDDNNGGGGGDSGNQDSTDPTPTPLPTNTPTPRPTNTPTPKPSGGNTTISGTNTITNMPNATAPVNNVFDWGSKVIETRINTPSSDDYSKVTIVLTYTDSVSKINDSWNGTYTIDKKKKTITVTTTPGTEFGIQAYTNGDVQVESIIGSN